MYSSTRILRSTEESRPKTDPSERDGSQAHLSNTVVIHRGRSVFSESVVGLSGTVKPFYVQGSDRERSSESIQPLCVVSAEYQDA